MINKSRVHGYIEVELNKKHGKRILLHENMLTQFGKSVVIGNGLGGIFSESSNKTLNKIRCIGTREYGADDPVGPYLTFSDSAYTGGSKITNLLLNNPQLSSDTGLYIPDDNTLAGYAALDKASSASLKEGNVAYVKDSQDRIRRLVRRFEYPSDLACEFNCIAMSTMTPTRTTGRVVPLYRSVQPVVFNSQSMDPIKLRDNQRLGYHKLTDNQIVFAAANGSNYTVNTVTGAIKEGGAIQNIYNRKVFSVFVYNNYTYVVKTAPSNYADTARMAYDVLSADGSTVATYPFTVSDITSSYSYGIIYYEGDFYYVSGWADKWYKLTPDSSGILTFNKSSNITPPITLPTALFSVIGNAQAGYKTIQADTTSFYFTDESYARTIGSTYNGGLFMCGNQILSFDLAEQYKRAWCNKLPGLVEYGNILSYHMLERPIQKNVGDNMYVTYSYTID